MLKNFLREVVGSLSGVGHLFGVPQLLFAVAGIVLANGVKAWLCCVMHGREEVYTTDRRLWQQPLITPQPHNLTTRDTPIG